MATPMAIAAAVVTGVAAHPKYIGCDLKVQSGKTPAGENIMSTAASIMGKTPAADEALVVCDKTTFAKDEVVTCTPSENFMKGFVHATAGTFTAAEFTGAKDATAAACTGTASIKYKNDQSATAAFTWTAPDGVDSVTLSFAGAKGYGQVYKRAITLTKTGVVTAAPTAAPTTAPTTAADKCKNSCATWDAKCKPACGAVCEITGTATPEEMQAKMSSTPCTKCANVDNKADCGVCYTCSGIPATPTTAAVSSDAYQTMPVFALMAGAAVFIV